MSEKKYINDCISLASETGSGLAIREPGGRYIFFLAAPRHKCSPNEMFFAGIGGHLKLGESWLECAQREAREELGSTVKIASSESSWYINDKEKIIPINLLDMPRPLILYEMIHPKGTQRSGKKYYIVIYKAYLAMLPTNISSYEMSGLIGLTQDQIIKALDKSSAIKDLIEQGALLICPIKNLNLKVKLYPLGTARALGLLLRQRGVNKPTKR